MGGRIDDGGAVVSARRTFVARVLLSCGSRVVRLLATIALDALDATVLIDWILRIAAATMHGNTSSASGWRHQFAATQPRLCCRPKISFVHGVHCQGILLSQRSTSGGMNFAATCDSLTAALLRSEAHGSGHIGVTLHPRLP